MIYSIAVKRSARKSLLALPRDAQQRIRTAIDALATNPRPQGSRKLTGSESMYRRRVGDYRIVYEIRDDQLVIMVIKLGHRRDVYR
jgi:mRNA interferase RelE/StbE